MLINKKALQRVVKAAQRTVGHSLSTAPRTFTPPDAGSGPPAP